MSKSTFVNDLNARIREAERVISNQNENLAALRLLLRKEMGESMPVAEAPSTVTPAVVQTTHAHPGVDFKGRTSEIILGLVQQSGERGTRPRDIAEVLVKHKLMKKGSNTVHSHLSELKARGRVKQKAEGLYVASAKTVTATVTAAAKKKAPTKHRLSAAGREAIRKAVKARWAAVKKAAAPAAKAAAASK